MRPQSQALYQGQRFEYNHSNRLCPLQAVLELVHTYTVTISLGLSKYEIAK